MTMDVSLLSLSSMPLYAHQPVKPLPRNGPCPLGYMGSGDYCVPGSNLSPWLASTLSGKTSSGAGSTFR